MNRYRYYGVYLTHEDSREIFNNGSNETCNSADAADPVDLLNNPVVRHTIKGSILVPEKNSTFWGSNPKGS